MSAYVRSFALAALAAVALATPSRAQTQAATPFVGSWTHVAQSDDVIEAAIEHGIDDMNFITRPIARRRLRATNAPYATMEIRVVDGSVTTVLDGRDVTSPADGRAVQWTREDGEVMQVATSLREDGTLVQTFTAEDGSRENVYRVSPDGRLTLGVTVRSERLPAPITYELLYDRAP